MPYLGQILDAAPVVANVAAYARVIHEKWRIRQLILACQRVSAQGYGDYGEPQAFIDGAEQAIYNIARTSSKQSVEKLIEVMKKAFAKLNDAVARGDRITGVSTGFERYDRQTAGLHEGDLTIIAARPGMGKTSFVLNLAANVAKPEAQRARRTIPTQRWDEPGVGVAVFSLEMPREQLANRMVCSEARVDVGKMRTGFLGPTTGTSSRMAASALGEPADLDRRHARALAPRAPREGPPPPVRVRHARRQRQEDPQARLRDRRLPPAHEGARRRAVARAGDQRDLPRPEGPREGARAPGHRALAAQSRGRDAERESKRPQLSDLRESGAIEQDADNIVFIYRDDYYNQDSPEQNIAELIIAKQRNGPTGTVKVRFDKQWTRFDNLAEGEYEDEPG